MKIDVLSSRLKSELDTLAGFSALLAPEVERIVFTEHDLRARAWFKGLCAEAGLDVREDAVGNTYARWAGSSPELPAVATGSHFDAIPHSGRYDGCVGVLGGLEAIRVLKESGFRPVRSIELILFTSEEPTRFGIGCLGSRLMCGSLDEAADTALRDSSGASLHSVRQAAGFSGALSSTRLTAGHYAGFVELHIEQGPLLEKNGVPIGVVTAIAAPASLRIQIEGDGGHAGAVLMHTRHDAFLAAAEIALALEAAARSTGSIDSVATTGICEVFPGLVNSVPSRAKLEADIRDIDGVRRDGMITALEQACEGAAKRRGVDVTTEIVNRDDPATCDPRVVATVAGVCDELGIAHDRMVSRAYHDSLFMSRICPTSMIFIPCRNGYSHRPEEYSSPEAIATGTRVLAHTLARLALLCLLVSACFAQKRPLTVDDVVAAPAGVSNAIRWTPAGDRFAISENGNLSVYTVATGKSREVISLNKLTAAAAKTSVPETTDWTNRRVARSDFQWFSDGRHLLALSGGDLFIVDSEKGGFETLIHTADNERDPKLSPDNKFVSFRRGHDLYVVDVKSKAEKRLTTDGSDTLLNGELDWVYPEELDLSTAHWWAPDSHAIAYLQFDVSREPIFPQVSLLNSRGVLEPERYPKAGDPNAGVRLGIVPVGGGDTKWMDLGNSFDNLLARVVWSPNSQLVLAERLNRVQNKVDLLLANVQTGAAKTVLHEEDKYWINTRSDPQFIGSGDRFLWNSERSGFAHLYLYGIDGKQRAQLTRGDWEVDKVVGIDEKHERVYYTSTEAGPIERQLYSTGFDGSGKRRLTTEAGTHGASLSPDGAYYMDDFSNSSSAMRSRVYSTEGRQIAVYREAFPPDLDLQPVENLSFKTADGTTLYGHLIRPSGFQTGRKYPAVVMIYGGPDIQRITNSWAGVNQDQLLAQKGFVIWQVDNRGSKGRGHAFESTIYHNMGAQELADQKEGIAYLLSLGFVDPARIGMTGWSYGGYMTMYTITHAPGLIHAAIAGAPVTNWRNYDSIYTERYMGMPEENVAGYKDSSPAEAAAGMGDTKLLILHNIEDDNVHFQNSVQMASALENAGKLFYMVVYPEKTHGVTGAPRRQMLDQTTKFFEDNLK